MTSKNAVCSWDFTLGESYLDKQGIIDWCKSNCKKWAFQLETGTQESAYIHFQGRVSLNSKVRSMIGEMIEQCRWSVTSSKNSENQFYVTKPETRTAGPWTDRDTYIPRQIREIKELRPWQQHIVDNADVWDTRHINIVYCPEGGTGKSTLCGWLRAYKIGRVLPPTNDYKDLLRMVCGSEKSRLYCFDMPRSLKKEKLHGFFAAIETIKDEYCYDDRYNFKEECFDCPNIWVFTNKLPITDYLSHDRWIFWEIKGQMLWKFPL